MKHIKTDGKVSDKSYAILRARCIWLEPPSKQGDDDAVATPATAVATTWRKVLATHKIRCNFILDTEGSMDSKFDDRTEALLQNVAIHSGFDLNLCENQSDNVLMHSSRPDSLHLSFTSCYLVVEMATENGTAPLLHLPVTPQPWDFSWSPDPTASLLSVNMNLTDARTMFQDRLLSKRHEEEKLDPMENAAISSAVLDIDQDRSCGEAMNLQAVLESEMRETDAILSVLFIAGVGILLLIAWISLKVPRKRSPSSATGVGSQTQKTLAPSSICVNVPDEHKAMSPITIDPAIAGTNGGYANLEEAWYKSRVARQRNLSRHEGKRFLQPTKDSTQQDVSNGVTGSPYSTPDRSVASKRGARKTLADNTAQVCPHTPNLGEDLPSRRNVQKLVNTHWGC